MGYAFEQEETLENAARRVASEELEDALHCLRDETTALDERIHEVRKGLKKLRALLRLLRDVLGDATFARENAAFRELGRRLSSARNAAATRDTLRKLLKRHKLEASDFRDVLDGSNQAHVGRANDSALLSSIDHGLRLADARVSGWPLTEAAWPPLERGLRRSYAKGKAAMQLSYREPTAEHFHEWRKRAKDHLYHLRLLSNLWQEPMKGLRLAVEDLTEALGDDHDLTELTRILTEAPDQDGAQAARRTDLLAFIKQRQGELREQARLLGERIYAERPKALSARFRAYYQAWRAEVPG
jgi:CHAD domain-containing protein